MKTITKKELKKAIEQHQIWLSNEGGKRLELVGYDLSESNLSRANLSWSNLSWSNLSESNLTGSKLSWSNLSWSNLSRANLTRSDLTGSNLSESDLSESDLSGSNLSNANLKNTILENKLIIIKRFGKHILSYWGQDFLIIGCKRYSLDFWHKNYIKIGQENGYNGTEIKQYGKIIKQCYDNYYGCSLGVD